jgi:hypothetical protein
VSDTKHDIAFLHTSPAHVPTFGRLMQDIAPKLKVAHLVREDLLADAQKEGVEDENLIARIRKAMSDASESGAAIVVCTCSTIGGVAESMHTGETFKPARIDRAMADRAVAGDGPVLLVAALESTLGPTRTLLESSAERLGTKPAIESLVVKDAWQHLLADEQGKYIEAIVRAVSKAKGPSGVVVLAQASMAPAAEPLGKLGITALSSPRLGVEHAVALCAEKK